ncbi:hypothetical protein ebA5920 [Aromatoleum aromaticum EbN1]|uniref:Uncharacterized protein n=1 Tax=Aromatoleum aromaticum (strain DSM 19018 / LMG 30748 / EbN1) TaxID=76114 RepID=Q5NZM1_AROAE|nr:hypothetical protein ebA5920 [Aromatoleum aromaticum EbN1]
MPGMLCVLWRRSSATTPTWHWAYKPGISSGWISSRNSTLSSPRACASAARRRASLPRPTKRKPTSDRARSRSARSSRISMPCATPMLISGRVPTTDMTFSFFIVARVSINHQGLAATFFSTAVAISGAFSRSPSRVNLPCSYSWYHARRCRIRRSSSRIGRLRKVYSARAR